MSSTDVLRVIDPRGYYQAFIKEGTYPDGRALNCFEKLFYKQNECGGIGSSVVTCGNATVSCSIDVSISPIGDTPVASVEVQPSQHLSEKEPDEYKTVITNLFDGQHFIKKQSLRCIDKNGKELQLEWTLNVVLKVLNADGNLLDAFVCAVTAALKDMKLPHIKMTFEIDYDAPIEKDQILVEESTYSPPVEVLLGCTFGVFANEETSEETLLVSPSVEIIPVCRCVATIVVGQHQKIVLTKLRGQLSNIDLMKEMIQFSDGRRTKFVEVLSKNC